MVDTEPADAALPEWAAMLTEQTCARGIHPTWYLDSEWHHACPWCRIDGLIAATAGDVDFQVCGDMGGPNGVGGECVLPPGHPHVDGIGGQWVATDEPDHRDDLVRDVARLWPAVDRDGWMQGDPFPGELAAALDLLAAAYPFTGGAR